MKGYLKLKDVKPEEVPEDTVKAVAETLKKSSSVKVSEDGNISDIWPPFFIFHISLNYALVR